MSILNFWVGEDRALVGVDTRNSMRIQNGLRFLDASKMFPIVHANCVLVGRGTGLVTLTAAFRIIERGEDFDAIDASMITVLGEAFELGRVNTNH